MHFPALIQRRLVGTGRIDEEDRAVSSQGVITVNRRGTGDSVDFHARHGRALHARAARESMATLLTLFRSWRRRRVGSRQSLQAEWPPAPRTSQCGRL
jgi:hypothetical protein